MWGYPCEVREMSSVGSFVLRGMACASDLRAGRSVRLGLACGHAERSRGRIVRDRAGTRRKHSAALEIALLDFRHRTCRSYLSTWETNPLRVHFSAMGPRLLPDC